MKPLKAVEATRKEYHSSPTKNTVHRTSLLVPHINGASTEVSFLNHFLLKRNITDVTCKVTALNEAGELTQCQSFPISEPRAYRIKLSSLFPDGFNSCIIEFFSGANLFIPFPAVMVNHIGDGFVNTVHAYNRVLNDVFEDDAINSVHNKEASIDVRMDDDFDTFIVFTAGVQDCTQRIRIELSDKEKSLAKDVPVFAKRLTHHWFGLKTLFPEFRTKGNQGAVLKIQQPKQFMFYGRIFAGQQYRGEAFNANHSYYDCIDNPEYWDDASDSYRTYPFMPGYINGIRAYPVNSPGKLSFTIRLHRNNGEILECEDALEMTSPGRTFLDISINDLIKNQELKEDDICAFTIVAKPQQGGHAPTRIGTQLIYSKGKLEASISAQLGNKNIFYSNNKKHFVWGQTVIGGGFDSWLGVTSTDGTHETAEIVMTFYDTEKELTKKSFVMKKGCAFRLNITTELESALKNTDLNQVHCIWYSFEAHRSDIAGYTVTSHKDSLHCTGEHSF